jgi:intein/homing endonuclease
MKNLFIKTKSTNDHFFDDLTDEKAQYVLGLIASDGNLSHNPKNKISITSKDREILEKVQKVMQTDYKVGFDGRCVYQIQIYSDILYNRCISLGLPERKSLILDYPNWANRHFIRGVFDGDGSVFKQHNRPTILCEFTSSSIKFINGLEEHLTNLGLEYHYRRDYMPPSGNPNYKILIHRNSDKIKFFDLIYKDATIWLNRKHVIFQKWLLKTSNIGETLEVDNSEAR